MSTSPLKLSTVISVRVQLFAYFRDLSGTSVVELQLPPGTTLSQVFDEVSKKYPELAPARSSCLMAVGLDYERPEYELRADADVSFFPPVQGG